MKLAPTIIIEINPEYFLFIQDDVKYVFETCVNYTVREGVPAPVAIGENREIPDATLVHLFGKETDYDMDKFGFLRLFIEYGLEKVTEQKRFPSLKPLIIFRGAETLKEALVGYHFGILHQAGLLAGAREVRFE
jgi:hypothetical protein